MGQATSKSLKFVSSGKKTNHQSIDLLILFYYKSSVEFFSEDSSVKLRGCNVLVSFP